MCRLSRWLVSVIIALATLLPQPLAAQETLTLTIAEADLNTSPLIERVRFRFANFTVDLQPDHIFTDVTFSVSERQFGVMTLWTLAPDEQGRFSWTVERSAVNSLLIRPTDLDTLNLTTQRLLEDIIVDHAYRTRRIWLHSQNIKQFAITEEAIEISIERSR